MQLDRSTRRPESGALAVLILGRIDNVVVAHLLDTSDHDHEWMLAPLSMM